MGGLFLKIGLPVKNVLKYSALKCQLQYVIVYME